MGVHYFLAPFNYDPNVNCDTLAPIQLLYSGGKLNAFVWQHPTDLEGKFWEPLAKIGIPWIIKCAPKCLYCLAKPTGKGVTIQHHYMRNTDHTCPQPNPQEETTCPIPDAKELAKCPKPDAKDPAKCQGLALTPILAMLLFSLFFAQIAL